MIATPDTIQGTPVCPICGNSSDGVYTLDLAGHPIPFRLRRCAGCGVVFNHPRLGPDQIRSQYDGEYYVFNEGASRRWARATQLYVEHLLPLENQAAGRRLLEIGCAGGELLALARYRGWQPTGIEISPQAAATARDAHGLNVLAGTLEEHAPHVGRFDVAIANDVIEHVISPRLFLQTLRGVLEPGGRLSLETPNWGSIWRRLGGPRWLGINRFHIFLFEHRSLGRLLNECGFSDCTARSSTNLSYTSWGSRPEITALLGRLPAGLRWRAERWADRLTPSGFALDLHRNPPASLEQALAAVALTESSPAVVAHHLLNDNLAVIGRA